MGSLSVYGVGNPLIDVLANVSDDELERPKPRDLPRTQRSERRRNDAGERV